MPSQFQEITLEQLSTQGGVLALNTMLANLFNQGRVEMLPYSLAASTSADAYAKMGETTTSATIGMRMPSAGSIIRNSCLTNVTIATSGDMTVEVRINDTNQSDLELEFNSSAGTGVASNDIQVDRHAVSFSKGDLVSVFLNETGTMVFASTLGFLEIVFDDD